LVGVDPAERQRRAIQKEAADVEEANRLGLDRREYGWLQVKCRAAT
jgi:hypothetical protein